VRAVLNEVHVARVRTESELGVERPGETSEAMPAPSVEQKPPDRRRDRITRKRFDDALAESLSWRQQLNDARVAHELDRAGWETARRALEGQLASSRSALEEATRRLESDRRDFEGRGQALLARIAELETATGTGTEVQAVLDETRRQLQATSDELGEARSMRDAARRDLEALGRELDAASARSKEVEGELAGVTREKQALETALGDARVEAARAGEVARVQLTESEASRQNLEREVKRLRSAAAAHRDLEAQLAAARAELRGAAQRHDAAGAAWDAERQRIERTLETEAAHIITAAAARTDLEDRLATVTTRKNALEAVLSELAGRVDRLAEESSALREQLRAVSTPDGRPLQPKQ
jgi:chromosome segregation ATPase